MLTPAQRKAAQKRLRDEQNRRVLRDIGQAPSTPNPTPAAPVETKVIPLKRPIPDAKAEEGRSRE